MSKSIVVAKILTSHGVRGNVKLESYMDIPRDVFKYADKLYDVNGRKFVVKFIGTLKPDVFMASVDGVNDMDVAKSLRNTELYMDMELLPKVDNNKEFYYNELIGLSVKSDNMAKSGTLTNVFDFGAGVIIEIKWENEKMEETLPFNDDYVKEVNIDKGYVIVNSPEYF